MARIELYLDMERETVNTVRFEEDAPKKNQVCKKIYVQKEYLGTIGDPKRIKVTIEAA